MGALTLLLAALAPCLAYSIAVSHPDTFSPLIAWSNSGVFSNGDASSVLYEVLGTEALAASLVHGASGSPDDLTSKLMRPTSDHLNAVIIYAGSQVDASTFRKVGSASKLQALLESADSSLVVPYSKIGGAVLQKTLARTLSNLDASSFQLQTVGCDETADTDNLGQQVAASLQETSALQVVLVCPSADDDQSLESELQMLESIQEAVEASELKYIMLYASQVSAGGGHGRALLQAGTEAGSATLTYTGFGAYTECGQLCQVQVRWLEGMLSVVFLALASLAGLTCLLVLNTPTRFEALKDSAAAQ